MERAILDGTELDFDVHGTGEPVLLIHGNYISDAFAPVLAEPVLTDQYRLITYHRVGHGGSTHPTEPVSIAQQAEHARRLLQHLGFSGAHVVGYSYGGAIALQFAREAPPGCPFTGAPGAGSIRGAHRRALPADAGTSVRHVRGRR